MPLRGTRNSGVRRVKCSCVPTAAEKLARLDWRWLPSLLPIVRFTALRGHPLAARLGVLGSHLVRILRSAKHFAALVCLATAVTSRLGFRLHRSLISLTTSAAPSPPVGISLDGARGLVLRDGRRL